MTWRMGVLALAIGFATAAAAGEPDASVSSSEIAPAASDEGAGPAADSVAEAGSALDAGPSAPATDPQPIASPPRARRFEVMASTVLHRDAFAEAGRVGRVVQGQLVTYLDFIDRRLRIFNRLVFDGGFWIKVRATDGTEGWLPASLLRALR